MTGVPFNRDRDRRRRRIIAAAVIIGHAALIAMLLRLERPVTARRTQQALVIVNVMPPPVTPAASPDERRTGLAPRPAGASAAAGLRATPQPVVAPAARLPLPSSIPAPPVAATGPDVSSGAADIPGTASGSAGVGNGRGGGAAGAGTGGGGGPAIRARRIRGGINIADYPDAAARAKASGRVVVTLDIGTDGRVTDCRIAISSGNVELDQTTCRLAIKRFLYRPASDARGRPVADVAGWQQDWSL